MAQPETTPPRSGLRRLLRLALLVASIAFAAKLVGGTGHAFHDMRRASTAKVATALVLLLAADAGRAFLWVYLVRFLSGSATAAPAPAIEMPHTASLVRAFGRSWLSRYLPGSVWAYGARMVNIDTAVTPARVVAVSLVDELALVVASCSSLGAALLATAHFGVVIGVVIGAALFAATIALTVRLADAANFTARIASRLLPRSLAERLTRLAATRLTWGQAAVLVVGYVLVHAAGGFSFWLLASGITGIGGDRLPLLAGAFNVAVVVGILAVFVPAGIGVREGVAAALAVSALSLKDATAAAVFVRLLGLAADVGFAGLADLAAGLSLRFGSS